MEAELQLARPGGCAHRAKRANLDEKERSSHASPLVVLGHFVSQFGRSRSAVCSLRFLRFQCRRVKNGQTHRGRGPSGRTDGRRHSQCQLTRSPSPPPPPPPQQREGCTCGEGGGGEEAMPGYAKFVARPRPSNRPSVLRPSNHRRTVSPPLHPSPRAGAPVCLPH